MKQSTLLSIIILSYNTRIFLKSCLQSIYKNLKDLDFEVIVVDNASKDDSVRMLKTDFSKVKIVENKENLGFSKANNIGAEIAKGKYLLFLNSDTEFKDDSLRELINIFEENEKIAVLGGKLENQDGSSQRSFGSFYNLINVFLMLLGGDKFELLRNRVQSNKLKEVDWIGGALMLVRRDVFIKLSGFDQKIFMYLEDMEFCYRIKKLGYKIYFYPKARVIHIGYGSSNRTFAIVQIYKGLLYFYKKHKSYWEYMVVKYLLILKAKIAIIIGTIFRDNYLTNAYKQAIKF